MNKPSVSIVMPMYNAQKLVRETLESVINQTYKDWEMIIVDNHSTDHSREIVKEYVQKDSRLKLIESNPNSGGPAKPRNIGIQNATGKFVAFIDADDIWHKNKLQECSEYFNNDIIYHQERCFNMEIDDGGLCKTKDTADIENLYQYLLVQGNLFSPSASVIRTEILKKNPFNEATEYHGVEDFDLWIRLAKMKKFQYKFLKEVLGYYRLHDEAFSKNFKKHGQKERQLIKDHFSEYSLTSNPYMFFTKYKKLFRSLLVNIIRTIQYKQKLDMRFYFKEFIKCF